MHEMVANGSARIQSYGPWIANRYRNQKNLVWMLGGDMQAFDPVQTAVEAALLNGLKGVPEQQSTLFSAEWSSNSISTDQPTLGSEMTLNGAYSWSGDVSLHGRRAYAYNPIMPAFLLEEPYDQEGPDGNGVNPNAIQPVRRFQWWGWLSTIGGYIAGNGYVWRFRTSTLWNSLSNVRRYILGRGSTQSLRSSWLPHLDTQGSLDMARLNRFILSVAWYKLVPSGLNGMRTLITAGGSSADSNDYVAAAAALDGTLAIAYIPPAHSGTIAFDMAALSGPTRARWFDPTSGAYLDIGTLPNAGARIFVSPGMNAAGDRDWVLVLDAATAQPTQIRPALRQRPVSYAWQAR